MALNVMKMLCAPHKTKEKGLDDGKKKKKKKKIKGSVVLMKKNFLDFNDMTASAIDRVYELLGKGVSIQLISADHADPGWLFCFSLHFCYSSLLFPL